MSTKAVCTHRILFFVRVSWAVVIASISFTIHSVLIENTRFSYINISNHLKESLYISSVNEYLFTTGSKIKIIAIQLFSLGGI